MMLATTTLKLNIPLHSPLIQPAHMQRSVVRHLLHDEQLTMPDALAMLSIEDQTWLVEKLIHDAEEALLLTSQVTDTAFRERYWQQYGNLLGYLLHGQEHWSPYHGQLLAILRMVVRRYAPDALIPKQFKLLVALTHRLYTEKLYREDIFAVTHALQDAGLNTLLDLSSSDDFLFNSYCEELGRA